MSDALRKKSRTTSIAIRLVVPVLIFMIWVIGARFSFFNKHIIPHPWSVFSTFLRSIRSGDLFFNTLSSLSRVFCGFFISFFVALFLGCIVILLPQFFRFFDFSLDFIRNIPPLAMISLLILGFGIGELSKILVVFLASFFPIFLNLHQGISECDAQLIEVGTVIKMSRYKLIKKIIIPSLFPFLLSGLRLGLCYGWRSLVGAEMIAASSGIGYMIMEGREMSQSDVLFVGIFTLGIIGVLFDRIFLWITSVFIPYQGNKGVYGKLS